MISILPFEPVHAARIAVRQAQRGEAERLRQTIAAPAALGPAFTVAETDADGRILRLLCCGGLAENAPDYATAWASFAEPEGGGRVTLARMIRRVLDASDYARIDMLVSLDFAKAHEFARHLGFVPEMTLYVRRPAPLLARGERKS